MTPETRFPESSNNGDEVQDPRTIDADSSQTEACMRPVIEPGDEVELVSAARRPPFVGDIVLARQVVGLRLHRLVWGPPFAGPHRAWRTASDRGVVDAPLNSQGVLATVVSIERDRSVNAAPRRGWMRAVTLSFLREGRLWLRKRLGRTHRP
jgi:hypothetical protein